MTPPASVTVGPSPLKILGTLAIVAIAGTVGVYLVVMFLPFLTGPWLRLHAQVIIVGTAATLVCYCVLAVLGAVIWRRPRVEIGPEGFVDYGTVGHRSRRWSDIEGAFVVIRSGWRSVVAYRLTDAFKQSTPIKPLASLAPNDEAILVCGELTLGARELADVLNQWKQGAPSAGAS